MMALKNKPQPLEKKSFIGANSALIAPLFLGEDTKVGAGTVVTESVSQPHARILSRTPQTVSFKENVEKQNQEINQSKLT